MDYFAQSTKTTFYNYILKDFYMFSFLLFSLFSFIVDADREKLQQLEAELEKMKEEMRKKK